MSPLRVEVYESTEEEQATLVQAIRFYQATAEMIAGRTVSSKDSILEMVLLGVGTLDEMLNGASLPTLQTALSGLKVHGVGAIDAAPRSAGGEPDATEHSE